MTEKSYYYDGTVRGDAQLAPYSSLDFNALSSLVESSQQAFVYEETSGQTLNVTGSVAQQVTVTPGKAFIYGVWYANSANKTIAIPNNTSPYIRTDRIVVRVDWDAQTARLALKMGIPAPAPELPELIQMPGEIYEFPLAYIQNAGNGSTEYLVIDERKFMQIYRNFARSCDYSLNENIMFNSELMSGCTTTTPPAGWRNSGCTFIHHDKLDEMERGTTCKAILGTGAWDRIFLNLNALSNGVAVPYTIKVLIEVLSGYVWIGVDGVFHSRGVVLYATNGPVEVTLRYEFGPIVGNDLILVIGEAGAGYSIFKVGQITVAQGNVGAPFSVCREIIPVNVPQGGTLATSGIVTTDLELPNHLAEGVKSLYMKLKVKDDASAAGNPVFAAFLDPLTDNPYTMQTDVAGLTNSLERVNHGFIGAPYADQVQTIRLHTVANGNMDVTYDVTGVVT